MKAIDPNIYMKLRNNLLESGFFNDDAKLNTLFVDFRLHPWRFRLPQANTPINRVDLTIAYLHAKKAKKYRIKRISITTGSS